MIGCPNCRTFLPVETVNTGQLHACPQCRTLTRADLFNAFHRPQGKGQNGELVQTQGEAECFYHPGKKAVIACSSCGRLLCALCEIPLDGQTMCTTCLQAGRKKQQIRSLDKGRTHYDTIALHLAFWPMLFFFFPTLFTAPAVIFVVLRFWNSTRSIIPRTKFRYVLAFLLACVQIFIWILVFIRMVS